MRTNWPPGVKAIYGFPRGTRREAGRGASEIQSLLFEKSKWTPSKAKDWLAVHSFRYGKMDPGGERADYYHFRQTSPGGFARMRVSTNPTRILLHPFTDDDWHAFGGAEPWSDGTEPMIGLIKVDGIPADIVVDRFGVGIYAFDEETNEQTVFTIELEDDKKESMMVVKSIDLSATSRKLIRMGFERERL